MIFAKARAREMWCPAASVGSLLDPVRLGATGCIGDRCAHWRAVDETRGYCGGGGPVLPGSDANLFETDIARSDLRIDRETRPAAAVAERKRR